MAKRPVRIVIDTNLFISFLINKDLSKLDKIIIEGHTRLVLSVELLEEIFAVIKRPKFKSIITEGDIETLLLFFNKFGELVPVHSQLNESRDEKDNFLLNLAIDGKATHLLTGDGDLLELKKIGNTKIMKLKDFLSTF